MSLALTTGCIAASGMHDARQYGEVGCTSVVGHTADDVDLVGACASSPSPSACINVYTAHYEQFPTAVPNHNLTSPQLPPQTQQTLNIPPSINAHPPSQRLRPPPRPRPTGNLLFVPTRAPCESKRHATKHIAHGSRARSRHEARGVRGRGRGGRSVRGAPHEESGAREVDEDGFCGCGGRRGVCCGGGVGGGCEGGCEGGVAFFTLTIALTLGCGGVGRTFG